MRFAIIYGINSVVFQIIIFQEIISSFYSNELFLSFAFGGWLISSLLGVIIAEKFIKDTLGERLIKLYHILVSFLGVFIIIFIEKIKLFLSPMGESVRIDIALFISFISSSLYSFTNGIYYSLISRRYLNGYLKTYYLEAIGYAIGVFLSYYILGSFNYDKFILIFIVSIINISIFYKKTLFYILFLFNLILLYSSHKIYNSIHNTSKKIIRIIDSPYARIEVVDVDKSIMIYSNSMLVSSDLNDFMNERYGFIGFYYKQDINKVAVIGCDMSLIRELIRYGAKEIYLIEKDEKLLDVVLNTEGFKRDNIKTFSGSAFDFFKIYNNFDVIILPPAFSKDRYSTAFFTENFLSLVKKSIKEDGIVITEIPFPGYSSNLFHKKISEIVKAKLADIFEYIDEYPDYKTMIVAAKKKISPLPDKNIPQEYLKYIVDTRKDVIKKHLTSTTDMFIYGTLYELSMYYPQISLRILNNEKLIFYILSFLIIFTFLVLRFFYKASSMMVISSFLFVFLEFIIVFMINILYGSLYTEVEKIILFSMMGLSIGCGINNKEKSKIFLAFLILFLVLLFLKNKYVFYSMLFMAGLLNGLMFKNLVRENKGREYIIYVFDITGGAIAVFFAPFLIGLSSLTCAIIYALLITFLSLFIYNHAT